MLVSILLLAHMHFDKHHHIFFKNSRLVSVLPLPYMLLTEIAIFLDESKLVPILLLAHMPFDKYRHIFGTFQTCVCLASTIHAIDRNSHVFETIHSL